MIYHTVWLEGLMLKLKLQYFGHLMQRTDSLEKTLMRGKIEDRRRRGQHVVGWYHQLDGHEFEQAPGVGDGQESLACCSPWGRKELDTTERLQWIAAFDLYEVLHCSRIGNLAFCASCQRGWVIYIASRANLPTGYQKQEQCVELCFFPSKVLVWGNFPLYPVWGVLSSWADTLAKLLAVLPCNIVWIEAGMVMHLTCILSHLPSIHRMLQGKTASSR